MADTLPQEGHYNRPMEQTSRSTLVLIRLWADGITGENQPKWHGRIQPIGEGPAATFSDWPTLQQLLQEMLVEQHEPVESTQGSSIEDTELWNA